MAGLIRKVAIAKKVKNNDEVSAVDGLVANRLLKNSKGKGPVRKVARYKAATGRLNK